MQPVTIRVFVSSTWLDLRPERAAVVELLQRFRETKFVGMEYFGGRDETTRDASLEEVDRSDLYIGIIGGRYGSGITEAEYERAHEDKACLIYFKAESAIPPEGRDVERDKRDRLEAFKHALKDPEKGHTVPSFQVHTSSRACWRATSTTGCSTAIYRRRCARLPRAGSQPRPLRF